ncbi:MAG: hypothetical protein OEV22_15430 [Deltaproteobacteria bacterium]|nr:hypothetical protein [Deltaproteobacteria bacterium]
MEKSTGRFAAYFYKVIEEDMTAGDAGVGSTGGDDMQGAHVYGDPDDTRIAKPLGKVQSRIAKKKKKKKKAKKVHLPDENEESNVEMVEDISDYM